MGSLQHGILFVTLVLAPAALAKDDEDDLGTPDGDPPSRESVCDGLDGAAFGLCNAFCEAQDCDVEWKNSCEQLRDNFERQTGYSIFPCEDGVPSTPTRKVHTATPTRSPDQGGGATPTFTPTKTAVPLPPTATASKTAHATATHVSTATAKATKTPTHPGTATAVPTTAKATRTPTAGLTATAVPVTSKPTKSPTAGVTATSIPVTSKPTKSPTHATPVPGTATPKATATFIDITGTPAVITVTPTGLPTGTATATAKPDDECAGLEGAAFGLCTAFCKAQDCPANPDHPSCDELRDNFEKITGMTVFPCEGALTPTAPPNGGHCMCDCAGDGAVTINDLTNAIGIVLGSREMGTCPRLVGRVDHLTVSHLVAAVVDALNGCS